MRVMVTGGAGFIGSHLVERLVDEHRGCVVVVDNLRRGHRENLSACWDRIAFFEADIREEQALGEMMRGVEVVFHLAAQSNVMGAVQDAGYSLATNVAGTFNVLRAASRAGVRRVVFTSSREVYGDAECCPVHESAPLRPKNAYGASKVAGEAYCRAFRSEGLETVILRLANVYGCRDRERVIPLFAENALRNQPLILYGEQRILDFIWVGVVVDALVAAGFGGWIEEPLNVGCGAGTDLKDLACRVMKLAGSCSSLCISAAREPEVCRFVADSRRVSQLLGLGPVPDPLFKLADVVEWKRRELFAQVTPSQVREQVTPNEVSRMLKVLPGKSGDLPNAEANR